jgi:hypothetical protein
MVQPSHLLSALAITEVTNMLAVPKSVGRVRQAHGRSAVATWRIGLHARVTDDVSSVTRSFRKIQAARASRISERKLSDARDQKRVVACVSLLSQSTVRLEVGQIAGPSNASAEIGMLLSKEI